MGDLHTFTKQTQIINKPVMSDKEIKSLIELAKTKIKQERTKKEILASFVAAGILDNKGEFTKPYEKLNSVVTQNS
jgi:hypothetical protein